jgi:[protein-PII] uridylyltransferase
VDVFYVTDLTGAKIVSGSRQAAIRRTLMEVLRNEDDGQGAGRGEAARARPSP